MLKTLNIENFRSHKKTIIDLCEGINCFVGKPGHGKTNIIRALSWLCTNRPLGFRVHSTFTNSPTVVEAEMMEGAKVKFTKTKHSSEYVLNDETHFKALGSDVPEEITQTLNLSELNFQRQLDQPFLITESPGEVARLFNKVLQLTKADQAVSFLISDITLTNRSLKQLESELVDVEDKISKISMEKILEAENALEEIEKSEKSLVVLKEDISRLEETINVFEAESNRLDDFGKNISSMELELEELLVLKQHQKSLGDEIDCLASFIGCIEQDMNDQDNLWKKLVNKGNEYKNFILQMKKCPFCSHCAAPIEKHNLDKVLEGIVR